MIKIKDSTALGAFAGMAATIPQLIFDTIARILDYSNYYAFQISASIYIFKNLTNALSGFILGGIVWETTAILLGVVTVFYMKYTGTDYWWLKGLFVSNTIMFTVIYGFIYNLGAAKIVPFDIKTNITILIGNTIFGIVMSYLIVRWEEGVMNK